MSKTKINENERLERCDVFNDDCWPTWLKEKRSTARRIDDSYDARKWNQDHGVVEVSDNKCPNCGSDVSCWIEGHWEEDGYVRGIRQCQNCAFEGF